MKSTGIVRRVDELGRIVLPKELRTILHIGEKDALEIYVEGKYIILQKHEPSCVFCGSSKRITHFREQNICNKCIDEIGRRDTQSASREDTVEHGHSDRSMKSTGIVRRVDELGRIVLPKELRTVLHINERDPLEVYVDGKYIVLQKYEPSCIFCGSSDNVVRFRDKNLCGDCVDELQGVVKTDEFSAS